MRRFLFTICILCLSSTTQAYQYKYFLGINGGKTTVTSGDSARYTLQNSFGFDFGYNINDAWRVHLDYSIFDLTNDTAATSSFSFSRDGLNATRQWQARRLGVMLERPVFSMGDRLDFMMGIGAGLMTWRIIDAAGDSTIDVAGVRDETLDFAAAEMFVTMGAGFRVDLNSRWAFSLNAQGNYLTGAGAEFAAPVTAGRDRWLYQSTISLTYAFGQSSRPEVWRSQDAWQATRNTRKVPTIDSDNDGIPDQEDNCLNTRIGAIVDKRGCAVDSDRDGVADGIDHCPGTPREALGLTDIYGCPIDSDFDGHADYVDACPHNAIGAAVSESGCPVDSDADGVPDGLDDCPGTLVGVDVDRNGCIDLSMLAKPMVLNIDYPSGSFEIDPNSRERIRSLSRLLNFVPDIKMDINGHTDNIGTTVANRTLSGKRANRVRDYLVSLGISTDRIKVFGKGESSPVVSNQTAAGRARNRRIEIMFYK